MLTFKEFIENNSIYYHGTTKENAESILRNGVDTSKYQSGIYTGFYLTPSLGYFKDNSKEVILKFTINMSKIVDIHEIKDQDLENLDPHFRMMSYGYKNNLIQKFILKSGRAGLKDNKQLILFNNDAVQNVELIQF